MLRKKKKGGELRTHYLSIKIRSNGAEATPPLGTVLGNLGVNTVKFCKEFNEFTKDLPNHFNLNTNIVVHPDRTYDFQVSAPSAGCILPLLKYQRTLKIRGKEIIEDCISLKNVILLAMYKFPFTDLKISLPILIAFIYRIEGIVIIY